MNLNDRILAFREGGQTQRCHTMQYTGPYNVAIHSYNALSLLFLLYPGTPRPELVRAVLWHDVPERWTGDVPAPAKWASPELKQILDFIEEEILRKLGVPNLFTDLTKTELDWLAGVDLLELFLWGREQIDYGNAQILQLVERVLILFKEKSDKIPSEISQFLCNFQWKRNLECHELEKGENDAERT